MCAAARRACGRLTSVEIGSEHSYQVDGRGHQAGGRGDLDSPRAAQGAKVADMSRWTKDAAIDALEMLLWEIDGLKSVRPFSARHTMARAHASSVALQVLR